MNAAQGEALMRVADRCTELTDNPHQWRAGKHLYRWLLTGPSTTQAGCVGGIITRWAPGAGTTDWRRSGSFLIDSDGTVVRGPLWFRETANPKEDSMDVKTRTLIHKLWIAIESAAGHCSTNSVQQAWYAATAEAHRNEREHRRSRLHRDCKAPRHFDLDTAARYFAVKWYLEACEYQAKQTPKNVRNVDGSAAYATTISVNEIIELRRDVVLAKACALYMLARACRVNVLPADIVEFAKIDYAVEMTTERRNGS